MPPPPASVLVADADPAYARSTAALLRARGFASAVCKGASPLDTALLEAGYDLVVCDLALLGDGIRARIAARSPDAPALILTSAFGSLEDEVRALREGAFACLPKPLDEEQLLLAAARALETRALARENSRLRIDLEGKHRLASFVTRNLEMRRVLQVAESLASTRATILLEGESGTGKSLLARAIHRASTALRPGAPFVEVSCGALPSTLLESELFGHARGSFTGATRDRAGKFEAADGGTLFLDEIGTASLELQQKLLRVLQDRTFERLGETRSRTADVRVVAATNEDLGAAVRAGKFREDLFWRIRVVSLRLPPLRERKEDVAILAPHFLARFATEHRRPAVELSPEALAALTSWSWPGNVRELEHCMERAVLLSAGPRIRAEDLGLAAPGAPAESRGRHGESPEPSAADLVACLRSLFDSSRPFTLREALEIPEREIIRLALDLHGGHRQAAARMLEVNRGTLFNKMRRYGLMGHPKAHHGDAKSQPRSTGFDSRESSTG